MVIRITRQDLLRHDLRGSPISKAPPWAHPSDFSELCTACGDCISACPEGILKKGNSDLPVVDFDRGKCTFCGECATACEPHALDRAHIPAFAFVADISPDCLAVKGITCRLCEEQCDEVSISFQLFTGGRSIPTVDAVSCTGCGACASVCPEQAIRFQPATQET